MTEERYTEIEQAEREMAEIKAEYGAKATALPFLNRARKEAEAYHGPCSGAATYIDCIITDVLDDLATLAAQLGEEP